MALRKVKGNNFFGSIIHINVAKIKATTTSLNKRSL